jgi:hypothetical protein
MKELAMAIMELCRGKAASEVYDALELVKDWVASEAVIPLEGIKDPTRDMVSGRGVERG